jgi:hypothetical protein
VEVRERLHEIHRRVDSFDAPLVSRPARRIQRLGLAEIRHPVDHVLRQPLHDLPILRLRPQDLLLQKEFNVEPSASTTKIIIKRTDRRARQVRTDAMSRKSLMAADIRGECMCSLN